MKRHERVLFRVATTSVCLSLGGLPACGGDDGNTDPMFDTTVGPTGGPTSAEEATSEADDDAGLDDEGTAGDAGDDTEASTSAADDGPKLDTLPPGDGEGDSGDTGSGCEGLEHVACDDATADPFEAMGLGCPGEPAITGAVMADMTGVMILDGWGSNGTYDPREGSNFVAVSTGPLSDMGSVPANPGDAGLHCNGWFAGGGSGDTSSFPPPIDKTPVNGDCETNPALVGTGDCSGSIAPQFNQSGFNYDYQDLRFTAVVPPNATSLSFEFAFLTKEYPIWFGQPFNDMFVAWIESESWTGNISFDQMGNPISLNAAFLEYFDDDGTLSEFEGTCMRYSAGTGWLETSLAVVPGEEIELVFAIFDVDDVNWDSIVFIDNVRWGCEDSGGPETIPVD